MKNKRLRQIEAGERQEECESLSKQERLDNIQSRRGKSEKELVRVLKMKG